MSADEGRLVAALRSAMKENARLREERDRAEQNTQVAVTAMACRLPGGADTPEALWDLVEGGGDAVGPLPDDRGWPEDTDGPPRSVMREGAFLDRAGDFDAGFFGISPKEALATDPQQRLLLETSWEAIERARLDPTSLRGTDTGVYVGLTAQEYGPRMAESTDDGLALTGTMASVASGRISYTLGLHGPSLSMDTACSSSLVAIHSAVRALRGGECSMALAGGAAVMSSDGLLVEFTRKGGLSPDGRCRAFGAGADGTGFSEGAVVLVLERLADARAAGRPVLAVVRGSAVNSDGASNGLTAPNGPAQARVIRAALDDAGLEPHEVDAVEAHGTGTTLGDPIEAQAVVRVYGGRRDEPLLLGSLKSNIGHAQAAAGAAGVVKAVQSLRHGVFPSTLHADEPTPHVDWEDSGVALAQSNHTWGEGPRPRRIAVSSFGISGTNVHLVLEQAVEERSAPEPAGGPDAAEHGPAAGQAPGHFAAVAEPAAEAPEEQAPVPTGGPVSWPISARSGLALHGQAVRLLRHLERTPAEPRDVALSLATTRARLEERAVVVGGGPDSLRRGLRALAAGESDPGVVTGSADGAGPTAFLFTGQGSQRPGMGRELHAAHPVFARAFDEVAAEFDRYLERPLTEVMWAEQDTPEADLLHRTGWAQVALFTFETALYRLLDSWGVRPDYVAGHSIGEITAAHVSGVLTLPDAVRLVEARGRLMQALPGGGSMAAVQAPPEQVEPVLAEAAERTGAPVALAAVNAPGSVVVSGGAEAVAHVASVFSERGHRTRHLLVSHAFHSPLMDPMLEDFAKVAGQVQLHAPVLPLVSNLDGGRAGDEVCTPEYWVRHVREPVRFADGAAHLRREGVTAFVEVGPDAALTAMVQPGTGEQHRAVALQSRLRPETDALATGVAEAHVAGVPVAWEALNAGARTVDLPTYAFQHRRFWLATAPSGTVAPPVEEPAEEAPAVPALRARLAGMSPALREEELLQTVRRESAVLLGHTGAQDVPADRGFLDLGFDSLAAVRLGARLGQMTGLELPSTVLLDHPTPRAVASHLSEEIAADTGGAGPTVPDTAAAGDTESAAEPEPGHGDEEVDGMDVDDLVRMVYDN
ncbi:acyltransferase domain-containing protein [Nocardiopsis sp. HNM0947]|uniref:Acyltransferase domain-containing protein n=1 Tax=Nocardiopsis coralli TaxID=2772213 RepID=A0ABR9PAE6_9ACTN|nr:type I polyketide synthase [Nocardiopsis coralli]MBE3000797.1 acyltransferase domain-containing protein [Nocardiopsis coralli]